MRVLVTGHDGYIGSVLTGVLARRGHRVTGLDTGYFAEFPAFQPRPAAVDGRRGDVRDTRGDDLAGFDAVVHLAALSNDALGSLRAEWTEDVNYTASVRLAEQAKRVGVPRFVFASSCSVYGQVPPDGIASETTPVRPLTAYATSKARVEEALGRLASWDFAPTSLRNATVYGLSPRFRTDLVLNNLVGWAVTTGTVRLLSDGSAWRPVVDVTDVAEAVAAVLEAPAETVRDQAFNVGAAEGNFRVRELAALVCAGVPGARLHVAADSTDSRSYRVDFRKLTAALPGYKAARRPEDAIRAMHAAMRAAGLTEQEFQSRRYVRLSQLRHLVDQGRLTGTLRWRSG